MSVITINDTLADAVMARPREFSIGKKRFCLWSPSLGMSMMIERHIASLGIDMAIMERNPSLESLRLAAAKKDEVCHLLSILTFRTFESLSDSSLIQRRASMFAKNLTTEEIAQLLLVALNEPSPEALMKESGILQEQQEMSRIAAHKNKDGHTMSFCGKTIYGTLIDAACSKYGWTKEYVVWGIDLLSLRMMLADAINTVYLSDEDMKALSISNTKHEVYGMTQDDINRLKAMDWS